MQPDLDLERADLMLELERVKAQRDLLRDGDRPRGGERAIIHAGAGDDVGNQADIGCGKRGRAQRLINGRQVGFVNMRQDHVLLVTDAQLAMAIPFGQIGQHPHLVRGRIARGRPVLLDRDLNDRIARRLVRDEVGVGPGPEGRVGQKRGLIAVRRGGLESG